jgi:two-component system, NarL family, response regulator LiaR
MNTHRCRVLIVDDHDRIRDALRTLLSVYDDLQVVGEARDGEEAINRVASCQPDIVLLDYKMPKMNGIEAASTIKRSWKNIAIIGLCVVHDTYTTGAFLKAGAIAIITKEHLADLHSTIQRACANRKQPPQNGEDSIRASIKAAE